MCGLTSTKEGRAAMRGVAVQRASSTSHHPPTTLPPNKTTTYKISKSSIKCRFSFLIVSASPPSGDLEAFSASLPSFSSLFVHSLALRPFLLPTQTHIHTTHHPLLKCVSPIHQNQPNKTPTPSSPPPTTPTTPSSPSTYNAQGDAFPAAAPAPVPPLHSQAASACAVLSP